MKIVSDTNLSKNDLEEICRGLGIPTEGTKADLIQKIRDYSNEGNRIRPEQSENEKMLNDDENDDLMETDYLNDEEDILEYDPQAQTLRELAQKSRGKMKIPQPNITAQSTEEQGSQTLGETSEIPKKPRK
ncbi:hypothetical protein C2G38_2218518 [Gigaspora rosea]|uniref:SAP domain-containing protein n=1 Tax=Gigaspora rosea TaxID=44941 RepID=A0A397UFF7_9GLOM|nr:hypothetical protein C2G38_2218518 [Gigaspora rosea]